MSVTSRPFVRVARGLVLVLAIFALPACQSGSKRQCRAPKGPDGVPLGDRACDPGTPQQRATIEKLIARIPTTSGADRIQLGRLIVAYGEPAIPLLIAALGNPSSDTRETAAWLLGFFGDPRAADPLYAATRDGNRLVRLEAAASLLKLRDKRGLNTVIGGLDDTDPRVRAKCIGLLEKYTGETFGYRADLSPSQRAAAVSRWRAWAARQGGSSG